MVSSVDKKIVDKIKDLKKKRNAVILAHNYQRAEVQDIADFLGDSLDLSRKAAQTDADVIVFCGVDFMAQTASLLSPKKKVLLPDKNAGCSLAEKITVEQLREMKKEHPEAKVVSYVNTTAEIKAESYICCTSSNSVKVVKSIPQKEEIIFIPDKYLCDYTSKEAGRDLICWQGYCDTHVKIKAEDVERLKREHPKAEVMAHPECIPEVLKVADTITSTGGMVKRAKSSSTNEFIIATELGIIHRLEKENPSKSFYPATQEVICPTMKMITLKKILRSLQNMQYEVKVKSSVAEGAKKAVDRMLAL